MDSEIEPDIKNKPEKQNIFFQINQAVIDNIQDAFRNPFESEVMENTKDDLQ